MEANRNTQLPDTQLPDTQPPDTQLPDPLLEAARNHFGIDYLFPFQRLAITNILEAAEAGAEGSSSEVSDTKPHQIIILPTGAGKSLIFMLPSVLLPGPTLVIFPLLGLISDQARRCEEAGIEAGVLRGGQSRTERDAVWRGVRERTIKMLLSNPETVLSPAVMNKVKESGITNLVIDEMHTVSEWGDTFRPAYLEIGRVAREARIPVISALTATASGHILERIKEVIFPNSSPHLIAANPDRPNISYRVIPSLCKEHDLLRLLSPRLSIFGGPEKSNPQAVKRPALVFCRTRAQVEMTARMLRQRLGEQEIYFYHAGLERHEKTAVEQWFFESEDGILCATCAYGMGVDKRNVRTVIHRSPAPSVEAYLQESGRGGRDRESAEAILLISSAGEGDRSRNISEKQPEQTAEEIRFERMVQYAYNRERCRRETLLAMLKAEPEACFGCDVCRGTVQERPVGERTIIEFVGKQKRRFTLRQTVQILSGRQTYDVVIEKLWTVRGFGALAAWNPENIRTAIKTLQAEGKIVIPERGFWKHRLTIR
jgi:ATP-dependent DNA helicase RecQ